MSRCGDSWLFAVLGSSSVLWASEGKSAPGEPSAAPTAGERGLPALFSWGDVNGDQRLDLAAVGEDGRLQLLVSAGEDRFEDVTGEVGLAGIADAALASWADYDGDGRLDLFVGARAGASRLCHDDDVRSLREEHGRELAELRARLVSLEERSAQATSVTPANGHRPVEEGASR